MENYNIIVHERVYKTIEQIQDYIASLNTYEAAESYSLKLFAEIQTLSNPILANAIQYSQWQTAKNLHSQSKRLITKNRKWNIIFHIQGKYVIIDGIIPTSLMK
jgi:hypothetical protein